MTIAMGRAKNLRDGQEYPYEIDILKTVDLDAIMALQYLIVRNNNGLETFIPMEKDDVRADLEGDGVVVGLKIAGELKGYFMIHYIRQSDEVIRFGKDIPSIEPNSGNVCRFRHVGIHPDFRGSSLAKEMSRQVMKIAGESGFGIRYMCTVVAPTNYPSLNHQFTNRMVAVSLKKYHEEYFRLVMFQDFTSPIGVSEQGTMDIPGSNLEAIRAAFREGHVGYGLRRTDGETHILFGRALNRIFMDQGA